jgi:hypothetical protein
MANITEEEQQLAGHRHMRQSWFLFLQEIEPPRQRHTSMGALPRRIATNAPSP